MLPNLFDSSQSLYNSKADRFFLPFYSYFWWWLLALDCRCRLRPWTPLPHVAFSRRQCQVGANIEFDFCCAFTIDIKEIDVGALWCQNSSNNLSASILRREYNLENDIGKTHKTFFTWFGSVPTGDIWITVRYTNNLLQISSFMRQSASKAIYIYCLVGPWEKLILEPTTYWPNDNWISSENRSMQM